MDAPHSPVGFAPEVVLVLFGAVPVTNTMVTAACVTLVLTALAAMVRLRLREEPSGLQNACELLVEAWTRLVEAGAGPAGRRFVPLLAASFLFILGANWLGTLPLRQITVVGAEGEAVPVFRSANSDLNLTAAMAVLVVVTAELAHLRALGPRGYAASFFWPNPMRWLELMVRPLSLAVRLFGNMLAGDVLLAAALAIAPVVVFVVLSMEIFVGLVQAIIFTMLSMAFLSIALAERQPEMSSAPRRTRPAV
jgi:F-type H+-transporting ATPase subunit a